MPLEELSNIGNVAIYVYWSNSKTLSLNTMCYMQELLKVAEHVLFVANSKVEPSEISRLTDIGVSFLQRENTGFDFWGWKEGIEYLAEKIMCAKNLILCNSSCFLAFNSLDSLLLKMNDEAEIWGISSFKDKETPFHLQSYFLVFKKKILEDWEEFSSFWISLPKMQRWKEAVNLGELRLTKFYLDRGFKCKAIVCSTSLPSTDINPSFYYPVNLFQNGSPFLKKKIFTEDYRLFLFASLGEAPKAALNFVQENGGHYDDILSELIVSSTPSQLIQTLQLNYFINARSFNIRERPTSKIAMICFVFYEDMIEYISNIILRFNQLADIYIISSKKELLDLYRDRLKENLPFAQYRLQKNRGRNEAAYFITCKDVWQQYDYVCAFHDKKTTHAQPALQGIDFMRHCEQNLCPSPSSIIEVIELFENNPKLGLLVPPLPFFGNFIRSIFNPLGQNKTSLNKLNNKLFSGKLFSSPKEIDVLSCPFGGMFWARSKALINIASSTLSIIDFPKEPVKQNDGTLLHAMERCYPMVTRLNGFYTARIINIKKISLIYNNLIYFTLILSLRDKLLFITKTKIIRLLSKSPKVELLARFIYRNFKNKFRW